MRLRIKTDHKDTRWIDLTKYKMWCFSIIRVICIEIGRFEMLSWVEKSVAQRKSVLECADVGGKSCGSSFRFNEVECHTMTTINLEEKARLLPKAGTFFSLVHISGLVS